MISLDTETTGVDFYHGASPFFVTTCYEDGEQRWWEWDVDPLTRKVKVPQEDLPEIQDLLLEAESDALVLQNAKFDVKALATIRVRSWPWSRTQDTLIAGHLLGSNLPHDLTSMVMQYLGVDIQPYEDQLQAACEEARRYCRAHLPEWMIARKGLVCMPSAKEKCWKYDTWLPRALARELGLPDNHPWQTVLSEYANADSAATLALWEAQRSEIKRLGLWEIYLTRLKLLPIAFAIEKRGVTISAARLEAKKAEYAAEAEEARALCVGIAASVGYELGLPKGGVNNSLRGFVFAADPVSGADGHLNGLNLPIYNRGEKSGDPSLDKETLSHWEETLPANSKKLAFVKALLRKRKRDTAVSYMTEYERFWQPLDGVSSDWLVLHPRLNITGTDTLRWSSSNPNSQNISKQEGFNLRYAFGPAGGREWWSLDGKNLELRIPAYEAGEKDLIEVFEHPDDPPYHGSYHLVVFDTLYPDLFRRHGKNCRDIYKSTWYQWVKNGNFAMIYGAQRDTADRAYRQVGAYDKVRYRFPKITALNDRQIRFAEKHGFVETIPDQTVCRDRGYPLLCSRTEWGKITPTVPLNYHIQGTAMWWTQMAMIRCHAQLEEWRRNGFDSRIVLQVHDELVFDLPAPELLSSSPRQLCDEPWRLHLPRVRKLQWLMEQGGEGIGVPTPVSVEYHPKNWSEGIAL